MKSSLKTKISLLLFMPIAVGLYLASESVIAEWRSYKHSLRDSVHGEIIKNISSAIHEIQRERGKSALVLNGSMAENELLEQRSKSDLQLRKILETAQDAMIEEKVNSLAKLLESQLKGIRSMVEAKEVPTEVSKAFGTYIGSLIELEVTAAGATSFESELNGPLMLDVAKENAGKIRAAITNILGANKALTLTQITTLQSLMSGITSNLESPLLRVSKSGQEKIEKFKSSDDWKKVNQVFTTVMNKSSEGNFGEEPTVFFAAVTNSIDDMSMIVQEDLGLVLLQIVNNQEASQRSMILVFSGTLIVTLLIGIFALYVIRAITKPINQVVDGLAATAEEVLSSFNQLQAASHKISSGTTQSAAALQQTVAYVEEMSSIISSNANSASEASRLSKEGQRLAESGKVEMKKMVESMRDLSLSSKKIEETVTIIDDIAFQINLLALNAAVEAARAGDQGKDFSVVAEAVRELAQRSAHAAKDIGQLISESVEKTKLGSVVANSSGASLAAILESTKNAAQLVEEISKSSKEQAYGLSQITKAMNDLDQATQANAASAEETSASADILSQQAGAMQNYVSSLNSIVEGTTTQKTKTAA